MSEVTEHGVQFRPSPRPVESVEAPVPRIAQLLALAIRFDRLLREGQFESMIELARLYGVSRSRATQVIGLLNLAPEIQMEILLGRVKATERELRGVVREVEWRRQHYLKSMLLTSA